MSSRYGARRSLSVAALIVSKYDAIKKKWVRTYDCRCCPFPACSKSHFYRHVRECNHAKSFLARQGILPPEDLDVPGLADSSSDSGAHGSDGDDEMEGSEAEDEAEAEEVDDASMHAEPLGDEEAADLGGGGQPEEDRLNDSDSSDNIPLVDVQPEVGGQPVEWTDVRTFPPLDH